MFTQSARTVWMDNMEYIEKFYMFNKKIPDYMHNHSYI